MRNGYAMLYSAPPSCKDDICAQRPGFPVADRLFRILKVIQRDIERLSQHGIVG